MLVSSLSCPINSLNDAAGMVFEGKHQYANSVDCFSWICSYSLPIARVPESVDGSDLKSADL